jgi:predicted nucleic acid-binding protein
MAVFVDTSALYALMDADDDFNRVAGAQWASLLNGGETLVSTNYVLVETLALVQRRLGMAAAARLQMDIVPVLDIHWVDESTHRSAIGALLIAGQRGLSLVDCVSFEIMRGRGIDRAFAFDADFASAGFNLLP